MTTLVVLMCLKGMTDCDPWNAPLVIRKQMTGAECTRYVETTLPRIQAGQYAHPPGGWYHLRCEPQEPKS